MRRKIAGRSRKKSREERARKVRTVEKVVVPAEAKVVEVGTKIRKVPARESLGWTGTLAEIVVRKATGRKIAKRKVAALM